MLLVLLFYDISLFTKRMIEKERRQGKAKASRERRVTSDDAQCANVSGFTEDQMFSDTCEVWVLDVLQWGRYTCKLQLEWDIIGVCDSFCCVCVCVYVCLAFGRLRSGDGVALLCI